MFSQIMLQSVLDLVLDPDSNSDFSDTTSSIPELVLADLDGSVSDDLAFGPSNSPNTVLTQWFAVEEVD